MRRLTTVIGLCALGFLLGALPPVLANSVAFTFTQFDVPFTGGVGTGGVGMNDIGQIVGGYAVFDPTINDFVGHGFLRDAEGNFSTIDFPGVTFTHVSKINDLGQIVGAYLDSSLHAHGFLLSGGAFSTIDVPFASETILTGINNSGEIVGVYTDAANTIHSFLDTGGSFMEIVLPGALGNTGGALLTGALFGVTQCCPNNLVRVDPATGQQTVIATLSPSAGFAGFQSATALDPASHTVFVLRSTFPPPPSPPVNELLSVNDQTGALSAVPLSTALFSLAFEAPTITPESIKADVLQAAASGAIRNSGLTTALLAKLDEAASARAAGDCATAANVYQAFVNELQAQSGKGVASDTAATLVSEAQFLAANCP